ncbi:MAG: hypothetical protein CL677_00915 [Bdellovibrionaceae bacterium]|nr:hypothetical protein [Pseudobdellovibrionaceae bacterium]
MKLLILLGLSLSTGLLGCSSSSSSGTSATSLNDVELTNLSGDCSEYTGSFTSSITDLGTSTSFSGSLVISSGSSTCTFVSNGIPNHDVNDSDSFATDIAEVSQTFSITSSPTDGSSDTDLSLSVDNGIFLNGAKLDLLPAACYGIGSEPLGSEKIGCDDDDTPWRYDPMYSGNDFGTDSHNAHAQPDGAYHYHGNPLALFDNDSPTEPSGVIGFAADGYPIYGPYIEDGSSIREVVSGYTLKSGSRTSQSGEGAFPGGTWDGTFRDDYEYTGAGDLDECNGMTVDGQYGYYVTNAFPWVMNCYKGTPDSTFTK